jgi:hypothetical protein
MDTNARGQGKDPCRDGGFECMPDLRLKRTPQPRCSPDICPSDFFLFGWLKRNWQQQFTDAYQLFEAVNENFSPLSVYMIEDLFRNMIHPLVQIIALYGDHVQSRFTDIIHTRLGRAKGG